MTKIGLRQFGLAGLLVAVLAGAAAGVSWPYSYGDDFSGEKAKTDSCIHSLFWLDRVTPPPGPYLYYFDNGGNQQLAFMGYQNQLAELGYCFPISSVRTQRAVKGWLTVDVSNLPQSPAGQLQYSVSGDGVAWSTPQILYAGQRQFPVESPSGTAYVRFSGTGVAIDNLQVSLSTPSGTISVPGTFPTIQTAIDAAANGDVIEVAPGNYSASGFQDIQFHGKAITLRSTSGPESTIISVGSGHRGFYFHAGEGPDSVLSGFTIRNAETPRARGAGIYCEGSSPTITDCIIQNCSADVGGGIGGSSAAPVIVDCTISGCSATYGGGIGLLEQSNATIARCDIEDNSASYGGGMYCSDSRALVGSCRITDNKVVPANMNGGGVYCTGALTDATFKNCVIASNSARMGAGIYTDSTLGFQRCTVTVANCTIAGNQVPYTQQGGGIYSTGTNIFVTNSIVWGNGTTPLVISNVSDAARIYPVTHSDVEGGFSGGNMNEDPLFANAAAGDYHLQSPYGRYSPQWGWTADVGRASSPCIDAGDPALSAADEPSPNGGRVNMGAYGATREASKSPEHHIWHVDANVSGSNDYWNTGLTHEQAFKTIGHALGVAGDGDTILVWPGVYREELVFGGKAVTLQSAADAAVLVAKNSYAISFYQAESPKSVVSNFVIKDCPEGAIYFDNRASPTLRNLTIVNNAFGIVPGLAGGEPYVVNCIFWHNGGDVSGCKAYFSRVQDNPDPRSGNIAAEPLFADPEDGDFHLQSAYGRYAPASGTWMIDHVTSPCVDAGNPEDYYEAELEPNGDIINMGAYGGTPYASKSRY